MNHATGVRRAAVTSHTVPEESGYQVCQRGRERARARCGCIDE